MPKPLPELPPKSGCSRLVPPLLIKAIKFAEFPSTGQLLISRFHQLSDGKSGNGWGRAPPREAFIANAGTAELARKATSVSQAKMDFDCLANKRKKCRFMTSPMRCKIMP